MQGFNLYFRIGYRVVTKFSIYMTGRLRRFLTICHTRRIMRFWLLCLSAVLVCAPVAPNLRSYRPEVHMAIRNRMEAGPRRISAA